MSDLNITPPSHSTFPSKGTKEKNFTTEEIAEINSKRFGNAIKAATRSSPTIDFTDELILSIIEPHLVKAREIRCKKLDGLRLEGKEKALYNGVCGSVDDSGENHLRKCGIFYYDRKTFPLGQILCDMFKFDVIDGNTPANALGNIKIPQKIDGGKQKLVEPMINPTLRKTFHETYDNLMLSVLVPLFVSRLPPALQSNPNLRARYQSFPCLRINAPGEFSISVHCDASYNHSFGNMNFYIPLTKQFGTNSLFFESFAGKEDWKTYENDESDSDNAMGYIFDGSQALHFTVENTTEKVRVSLDCRIALFYDEEGGEDSFGLPSASDLEDHYSKVERLNYYSVCNEGDEGWVRIGDLGEPSCLNGFPHRNK